jgi:CRP/FNR family transcriptional regulator, cyclic AMP receptor protein
VTITEDTARPKHMNADPPRGGICHVLRSDLDLAEAVPIAHRERAAEECIAATLTLDRGQWSGRVQDPMPGGIGLLILSGLLLRRVGISRDHGAELLAGGDIFRPWLNEEEQPALPHTTGWRVLEPTQLAVLDRRAAARFARYPELTGRLVSRALERARSLAVHMAIAHQARVHIRVHMLLWHLANRWGRVRPDGIIVPLRLTHSVISELVAARRPTVSTALSRLAKDELVRPVDEGWLLLGDPPGELLEVPEATMPEAGPRG